MALCDHTPSLTSESSNLGDHILMTLNNISPLACQALVQRTAAAVPGDDPVVDDTATETAMSASTASTSFAVRRSSREKRDVPSGPLNPPPVLLSRTLKPREEAEVISILPVVVVNLTDGPKLSSSKSGPPPKARRWLLSYFNTDVEIYVAPREATAFYGSQWAKDGTFLGPQRSATIFVFPDQDGLQVLREGVAKGWGEKEFIAHGYGMVSYVANQSCNSPLLT